MKNTFNLAAIVVCGVTLLTMNTFCMAQAFSVDTITFSGDTNLPGLTIENRWFGYQAGRDRDFTGLNPGVSQERAYDYSVFLMKDGPVYRMYHGGRFRDKKPNGTVIDGDHIFGRFITPTAFDADPTAWNDMLPNLGYSGQEIPSPLWLQPQYNGDTGKWYSNNTLEPEVIKKDGLYYMYSQVEIKPGETTDTGQTAITKADRIQLYTSNNASDWLQANPNRGVVTNITNPATTDMGHQEMMYVPSDNTGRPWWMYVRYSENDIFKGHVRIRSADPSTFDWNDREFVSGMSQLGNQIAYFNDDAGQKMFMRITFTNSTADPTRTVPTLQFSRTGLSWFYGDGGAVELEGSQNNDKNKNTYFLGFSTIDGTGEVEVDPATGKLKLIYAASTANGPTAANGDIFFAEIGLGEMYLTLSSPLITGDLDGDGFVGINDLNIILSNWNQTVPIGDLSSGDILGDGDGFVGIGDLNVMLGNWNAGAPPPASAIPEPATVFLIATGVCIAVLRRRSKTGTPRCLPATGAWR